MFIKLKNESHINANKIISISPDKENYLIEMQSGPRISLDAAGFPWLIKICGFLVKLKSGHVINTFEIVSINYRNETSVLTLSTGTIFELTSEEVTLLMGDEEKQNGEVKNGLCEYTISVTHLENRAMFLESKNVPCEDYKKL